MNKVNMVMNEMLNYMKNGPHTDLEIFNHMIDLTMKYNEMNRNEAEIIVTKNLKEMGVIIPNK